MSSTPAFASRVAVVTGANKGIGFYIAMQLASSGLFKSVLLGCRDTGRGEAAVKQIQEQSQVGTTELSCLQLELNDEESRNRFASTIEDRYGKIDVLCNNAAMAFKGSDPTPFAQQCKPTLDVNFRATVDLTEKLLPLIRRGTDPRIVNVASSSGALRQIRSADLRDRFASPSLTMSDLKGLMDQFETDVLAGVHAKKGWGNSNYGMSKLALIAATKIWAREEAKNGVTVNCIDPGYCATDMSSHRGPRHPADGAKNAVLAATMENPPTGEYFSDMKVSPW